jgi:hypothetical protein
MIKKRHDRAIKTLLLAGFVFFILWGIIAVVTGDNQYIFDRFFSAGLVLVIFALCKSADLKLGVVIFALAVLLLHHLKLYGTFFLGMPFDKIMHFTAGIALGLLAYNYLLNRTNLKKLEILIISVLIAAGVGSIMEIIEFIGYSAFGEGEGLLFFGKGDFGEWFNASWDLMCNTVGAIGAGIFGYLVFKK